MAVSPEYRQRVLDRMGVAGVVRARSMFGGVGVYIDEVFCGVLDNDRLYLKVDELTRSDYTARNMPAFTPMGEDPAHATYFAVPAETLDDPAQLRDWVGKSVEAARRSKARKKR